MRRGFVVFSAHVEHGVRAFALAQEEVFAEQEVRGRDGAGDLGRADVVHVDTAAFDVFFRLAFRGSEAGVDEQIDERSAGAIEFGAFEWFGGDFADEVLEGFFGGVADLGTEKNFAGFERGVERGLAVDEARDFAGEGFVGFARAGIGEVFDFEFFDLGAGEESELF